MSMFVRDQSGMLVKVLLLRNRNISTCIASRHNNFDRYPGIYKIFLSKILQLCQLMQQKYFNRYCVKAKQFCQPVGYFFYFDYCKVTQFNSTWLFFFISITQGYTIQFNPLVVGYFFILITESWKGLHNSIKFIITHCSQISHLCN